MLIRIQVNISSLLIAYCQASAYWLCVSCNIFPDVYLWVHLKFTDVAHMSKVKHAAIKSSQAEQIEMKENSARRFVKAFFYSPSWSKGWVEAITSTFYDNNVSCSLLRSNLIMQYSSFFYAISKRDSFNMTFFFTIFLISRSISQGYITKATSNGRWFMMIFCCCCVIMRIAFSPLPLLLLFSWFRHKLRQCVEKKEENIKRN